MIQQNLMLQQQAAVDAVCRGILLDLQNADLKSMSEKTEVVKYNFNANIQRNPSKGVKTKMHK